MDTVAAVGGFTALFAATIALRQFDLKKVFAYSTISQLGYMFVGVGVLAPTAAIFHLVTHAFFKALLFLNCGVVMHAMLGHLDMRKMSGLKKVLPMTNWLMLIGCAALAGFPGLSGFFSKDEIVAQSLNRSVILYATVLFTAFLTAYYTFRLYFQVFQGPLVQPTEPAEGQPHHDGDAHDDRHDDHHDAHDDHHNHEPMIMIFPLMVLAVGALAAGYLNWPQAHLANFLGRSPSVQASYQLATATYGQGDAVKGELFGVREATVMEPQKAMISPAMLIGGLVSVIGILLAYLLHLRDRARAERLAEGLQPLTGLLEAKYYVDEIYQSAIVEPLRHLGEIFFAIDRIIVDGIVWLIGFIPQLSGFVLKLTLQRGYLQGYATTMLFGILAVLLIIFL